VLAAAGKGGVWDGGIVAVVNRIAVGDVVAPFDWKAVRRNALITLSGHAPSEDARAALAAKARTLFPGGVHDEQIVAAGAPSGDWLGMAMGALDAVAVLPDGDARLVGRRLILMGEADRAAVNKVRASYAARDLAPFEVVLDVSEAGVGPPELAGIKLAGADAGMCQEAFTRIMARNMINFDTGSAAIAAASLRVLDTLAAVARRCDAYAIEVDGHTDNVGARGANMSLSRARAQAVVNYLAAQGVAANRVSAVGFGPDRPVTSNATRAGQARNRRIEFQVRS
jgi:OOP family OmpA-OmpF porin